MKKFYLFYHTFSVRIFHKCPDKSTGVPRNDISVNTPLTITNTTANISFQIFSIG